MVTDRTDHKSQTSTHELYTQSNINVSTIWSKLSCDIDLSERQKYCRKGMRWRERKRDGERARERERERASATVERFAYKALLLKTME